MAFSQENDVILIKLEGAGDPTVYVPPASYTVRGLASFSKEDFVVSNYGHVDANPIRDIAQGAKDIAEEAKDIAEEAKDIAESVEDRADAGEFTGPQGPIGPVGPIGEEGPEGPQGPAGIWDALLDTDGNYILDTDGNPITVLLDFQGQIDELNERIDNLPNPLYFAGNWDPTTNTPELLEINLELEGAVYRVTAEATRFGLDWKVGDKLVYQKDGYISKWDVNDEVTMADIQALEDAIAQNYQESFTINVDLSDKFVNYFGDVDNPLDVSEISTINFVNFVANSGTLRSFILHIRRTADVAVTWEGITKWADNEIPLLPVGRVQKILIETVDGENFIGSALRYYD